VHTIEHASLPFLVVHFFVVPVLLLWATMMFDTDTSRAVVGPPANRRHPAMNESTKNALPVMRIMIPPPFFSQPKRYKTGDTPD
jgi:hypothetical protein